MLVCPPRGHYTLDMASEAMPQSSVRQPRRMAVALLGLLLSITCPAAYALTVDSVFVRRTAAPMWAVLALGVLLGLMAIARDRRLRVRIVGGLNLAAAAFWIFAMTVLAVLPEATSIAKAESAPDFTVPNQDGKAVSL